LAVEERKICSSFLVKFIMQESGDPNRDHEESREENGCHPSEPPLKVCLNEPALKACPKMLLFGVSCSG